MNETKATYLHRIRSQSAYPWIRRLTTFVSFIFYSLALLSLILGFAFLGIGGLFVLPGSIVLAIAGVVLKEASIMLADIADSITDLNCRYEQ